MYLLHNEELHSLCHSTNIIRRVKSRRLRLEGLVARMEEDRGAFKIERPLGRPRSRWEDNIRVDLTEVGNWVDSTKDRNY